MKVYVVTDEFGLEYEDSGFSIIDIFSTLDKAVVQANEYLEETDNGMNGNVGKFTLDTYPLCVEYSPQIGDYGQVWIYEYELDEKYG